MLPRPHVTSSWLAKQKKIHMCWSAASQPPLTCWAPGQWSGSTGEMISSRAEVCVYLQGKPLSRVRQVGNKYQVALLYLEEPSPLFTDKLQPILYTLLLSLLLLLLLLLLPLPFIYCPHVRTAPSLSLSLSHLTQTHLTHRPIPKGLCHS